MEPFHHSSDLDPSSVLGFGSALVMLDSADEVARLLTGALRSMGLADLQAVVLAGREDEDARVVGSLGTRPLPDSVVEELRRLGTERSDGAEKEDASRRRVAVCPEKHPALTEAGVQRLSVVRLGTIDEDFGLVVAGHTDETTLAPMQASALQMMAAQVSMALHRIRLNRKRKRKAEALRSSEARYRELYEHAPVAYVSVNGDGEIQVANRRAAELLGTTKETLVGNSLLHFCTDAAEASETVQRLTSCIQGRERLYDREVQLCRADGEQIWVRMSIQPLDATEQTSECLVMMTDITERVEMETALRETRDELEERVEKRTTELEQTNEQLRRQTKRLETLRDVDRAILGAESPAEIATVAAERAQEVVPCERVSVALFDWSTERVTVLTARQSDEEILKSGTDFPVDDFIPVDRLKAGQVEELPDFDNVPPTPITNRLHEAGIRSALVVPMLAEDELIGTVNLGTARPHAFTEAERRIGEELADHLAIALRQSRLLEAVQEQRGQLATLRDIDEAILAAESPHEIASVAARRVGDIVPCERVSVSMIDWEDNVAQILAARQDDQVLDPGTQIPLDEFYLSDTLRSGEAEILADLDDVSLGAAGQKIREKGIRSALLLPLMIDGTLAAMLQMGRAAPNAFTEKDREMGRKLADHLAIALRQSRLLETVQEKREQLATLRDIDEAILAAESPQEIADQAIRRTQKLVPYESATVTAIDWEEEEAHVLAAENNVLDAPVTLPLDEVYLSDDLRAGRTEVISDDDYEPVPEAQERMREMNLRSILCLPMMVEGEVIGVIHVGRTEPDAFTEDDWQVGRELADHMAIAIRQSRLLEAVQEQRERLEERVQERTEELESFTYSVSHDLRTPLRAIDGYTKILKEEHADRLDEEGRDLLNVVHESAQTMGDLIDDLLTLSRLGRREMHPVPIEMDALVKEAYDEIRRANPDAAETVTLDSQDLPPALGDRSMIRQVLVNLLSNALKFTQNEETPRVDVGAADRGDEIVYYVRDNGVGFSMEYADKLFGVFERLHDDNAFEGTGVGLALVERIVRRHGGEVWAEGASGKGATIYFTLPESTPADNE